MNRRQFFVPTTAGAVASVVAASQFDLGVVAQASAQEGTEPLGGQPPPGSTCSIKDFDYQIKHQRAFEAVLWNMASSNGRVPDNDWSIAAAQSSASRKASRIPCAVTKSLL